MRRYPGATWAFLCLIITQAVLGVQCMVLLALTVWHSTNTALCCQAQQSHPANLMTQQTWFCFDRCTGCRSVHHSCTVQERYGSSSHAQQFNPPAYSIALRFTVGLTCEGQSLYHHPHLQRMYCEVLNSRYFISTVCRQRPWLCGAHDAGR